MTQFKCIICGGHWSEGFTRDYCETEACRKCVRGHEEDILARITRMLAAHPDYLLLHRNRPVTDVREVGDHLRAAPPSTVPVLQSYPTLPEAALAATLAWFAPRYSLEDMGDAMCLVRTALEQQSLNCEDTQLMLKLLEHMRSCTQAELPQLYLWRFPAAAINSRNPALNIHELRAWIKALPEVR